MLLRKKCSTKYPYKSWDNSEIKLRQVQNTIIKLSLSQITVLIKRTHWTLGIEMQHYSHNCQYLNKCSSSTTIRLWNCALQKDINYWTSIKQHISREWKHCPKFQSYIFKWTQYLELVYIYMLQWICVIREFVKSVNGLVNSRIP